MPRVCTVCTSDDRRAIDEAVVGGQPIRAIARRFEVTRDSVTRHRSHVSQALVAVQRRKEDRGAETLADRVESLYERASTILDEAVSEGRATVALGAVRELRSTVELLAKLSGELDTHSTTNVVNLITSDDWIAVRAAVLDALVPFPDARAAVAARLLALEPAS